jgi:transposase
MFIKRNRSLQGGKIYDSVLLVHGERVAVPRGRGRPRKDASAEPRTRVRHRTLANLSQLPSDLVALIERYVKGAQPPEPGVSVPGSIAGDNQAAKPGPTEPIHLGPCYGVLAGLHALAQEIGLVAALGPGREARLALFLIYARIARQGSRLGAVRWAEDHAVSEILGLEHFDEDDLYATLDWLKIHQERIEKALFKKAASGAFFLYDVTSSYFEGQHNELAEHGYNRDGKRYKKQVVAGLLTDATGEPVSIQLYPGNTSDVATFCPMVDRLKQRFAATDVVLVGDRGMIKKSGLEKLSAEGMRYVTALTDPQTRQLISQKVIDPELFDEEPAEVTQDQRRLILRLNPELRTRDRQRRDSQLAKIKKRVDEGNQRLAKQTRAKVETLQKKTEGWVKNYGFGTWLRVDSNPEKREVKVIEDTPARANLELLDGCYVLVTDVPKEACATEQVCARYKDLQKVERDFRSAKTGHLEIRPIFLRKAERTEGHAFVTMLALKLSRQLDQRIAKLGLTVEDAVERLGGVRLVGLGPVAHSLWRLPCKFMPAQQEILDCLPSLGSPLLSLAKPIKTMTQKIRKKLD